MIRDIYIKGVAAGGGGVTRSTATLMKTGQTASFRTGDDRDLEAGRDTDFLTLDTAPLHDDGSATINTTTNRFTDILGGQTYTDDIVLDWSTWNGSNLMGWYKDDFVTGVITTWANAIDNALLLSVGLFSTWRIPNLKELINLMSFDTGNVFNYAPFNNTTLTVVWSSTTAATGVTSALTRSGNTIIVRAKTQTSFALRCRTFILSTSNILS